MTTTTAAGWGGLSYAALENAIVAIHGADREAVKARFRKLRLRPFPDDIRSRRGVRVAYDLPRVLAILAVFELNALQLPQGQAVAMVEASWPEWCRAAIAAACDLGMMQRPGAMPRWSSTKVTLLPDAFARDETVVAAYATDTDDRLAGAAGVVMVDAARPVAAIFAAARRADVDAVSAAFAELELSHGWTRRSFPTRQELADLTKGRGFLEDGPYLARAGVLLDARLDDEGLAVVPQRARLHAILDYLEDPVPVDAWKAIVGSGEGELRLGQLLQAFAVQIGLEPRKPLPATILTSGGTEPRDGALALIEAIRRI